MLQSYLSSGFANRGAVKRKLQDVHCTALRRSRFAAAKAVPLVIGSVPDQAAAVAPAAAAPAEQAVRAVLSTSSSSGAEYEDVDAMLDEVIASPVPPL